MLKELKSKEASLAVVGLGYVGLPISLAFARHLHVIGFDINASRIEMMKQGQDPSRELDNSAFEGADIEFTTNLEDLRKARFYIIAVPTPVDNHKIPDLNPLLKASESVGKVLKKGDYVVYESTVYPGCTEEDCVPVLEKYSGLEYKLDFKVGYSPERINPGDREHTLSRIVKVVSACDEEALDTIAKVYEIVVEAGVFKAASIKVAEAAKIIENTQRDVNIALMNELSKIFDKMDINTFDVLEAAATKWNFLKFYPGMVGGHCIGVDPYYLTYKSTALGYVPEVILGGRRINDDMPLYVAKKTIQKIILSGKHIRDARILVMGATFKENVSDIRNSKVADLVNELKSFSIKVDVIDPYADADEVKAEYGFELNGLQQHTYDAIIVAVNHSEYKDLDEDYFLTLANENCLLVDIKGEYRGKINKMQYWSL